MKTRANWIIAKTFHIIVATAVVLLGNLTVQAQEVAATTDASAYTSATHVYKIVAGHEIRADVYRSPGEEIRPAVIWIHGGALIAGSRGGILSWKIQKYLGAGFVVVSIDYRLAPETKLPAIIEDLEDAYAWVRTEGPSLFKIDPARVAVVGHSAGGYLTLMAGFRLKPRPRALVSFYGYGDITGRWYSQPDSFHNQRPPISKSQAYEAVGNSVISNSAGRGRIRFQFYIYCRQQGLWPREVSGHDPEKERSWYFEYEPLRNVTSAYPPTMLLHGEEDTDVPFQQSVLMAEAFELHNVDYEFLRRPDWGHGFDRKRMVDSTVQEAFSRVLAFLQKNLE